MISTFSNCLHGPVVQRGKKFSLPSIRSEKQSGLERQPPLVNVSIAPTTDNEQRIEPSDPATVGHVPAMDGLRTLAIRVVLAVHAGVPGSASGWLGVDPSRSGGFLITALLLGPFPYGSACYLRCLSRSNQAGTSFSWAQCRGLHPSGFNACLNY